MGSNKRQPLVYHENIVIQEALIVLDDFLINITPEMVRRLEELYPNTINMENYTHSLIVNHIDNWR